MYKNRKLTNNINLLVTVPNLADVTLTLASKSLIFTINSLHLVWNWLENCSNLWRSSTSHAKFQFDDFCLISDELIKISWSAILNVDLKTPPKFTRHDTADHVFSDNFDDLSLSVTSHLGDFFWKRNALPDLLFKIK